MQERWRMNKLGFVNFWLYDWEEFPFSEGRLLLRGENGAGKSVTTQSFIPFMLDGDLRPYRLDSFGSKDRKMSYYLLGEDKEESTGYLYLEFIKPEHRLYRTLVVGLRARRSSSSVEFWGFCLSDGRRIGTGPEDFALFETKGSQHISLTRQEVHNRFGAGENWVERGSDYKQMVNRMLFGCAEMEQYDRLLRLLIQLRKPKLSKDFSPRLVQEILNASLQPLSEEDIAPMVNSMEKMDTIQHRLEALGQSLQEARQLRNEYTRYNQYMLGKKAHYYLAARQFTQQRQAEVQSLEDKVALTQQALEAARADHQEAEQQVGELSRQLEVLREGSDLDNAVRRKEECRRQAAQQQEAVAREQREEQRKQNALDAKERERLQAERRCADQQELLQRNFRELAGQNEELCYPGHPTTLQAVDFQQEQPTFGHFAAQLRKAAELLRRKAEALQQLDRYQQDQDNAAQALRHAQTEWEEARRTVGTMRDALSEAFAALEEPTQAFCLRHGEVTALFAQVTAYEGLAQEQEMQKILNGALQRLSMPLVQEHTLWERQQTDAQQQLNELAAHRKELESQKELPPPRSEAVESTRAYLRERGVPYASFYELVDFAPDLPPERRALLEAQLADTGILDALVLPAEALEEMPELLAEHPDHFLCPEDLSPAAPLPLRPETELPAWADMAGLLSCFSEQPEGNAWFAADGRYRQGVLQGRSVARQPAGYIGASARRANRERQIEALARQMEEKQKELEEIRERLQQIKTAQQQLQQAYEARPTTADLAVALDLAAKQRGEVERRERTLDDCAQRVQRQQKQLADLRAGILPLTQGLPYEQDAETYGQMVDLCEEYREQYRTISEGKEKLELWQSQVLDLEQQLDALNEDLLACTDRVRRQQAEQRKTKAALEELECYLTRPEIQALAQKLEELNAALDRAQKQYHETDTQIQLRQNDLDHQGPELTRKKQDLQKAIGEEEALRQIFEEELCRGPGQPGRGEEPLWRQAETARDRIRQKDRNLGPDDLRTSLEKNMHMTSTLNTYRMGIQPLFASEEGRLRSRVCIELYLDGQRLDLLDFIRRLESQRDVEEQLLSQEDRRLFETILNQTVITKLSHRINNSQEWTQRMSGIMEQLNTSMGLRFSLVWKGKPADQQKELDTGELIKLLRKDPALMGDADRQKITDHFRAKINRARERSQMEATPATYSELMREALDFRNWFTFRLFYQKGGAEKQTKKELTDSAFNSFSGGEKAMAMYVPLFAALAAQYAAANHAEAPRLMALDEAFAGVDETNIESMFALVHELGFDYIMNSQALWGCYPTVSSLNIAELWRPQNARIVTVLRYHWDGHVRRLEES
ncbi:SbcC/MukB-like Walker B domain-containing protein [uncultured Subdoligranulum sp.]|uniref:SbcC/MukB-like Walker B domain-containing protein n=1 Tax=uncultured Subdoligranulum sp. TaxID=512298 RepID=UPI002621C548|nr:SbcC/MukB-like Walker B domain-containing protein [uncultured Subdoligranulum sp.]